MQLTISRPGWAWLRAETTDDARTSAMFRSLLAEYADVPGAKVWQPEMDSQVLPSIELPRNLWRASEVEALARTAALRFPWGTPPAFEAEGLYPHQQTTVERVVREGCGLIAHPMGLGKTRCAIRSALALREEGATLIVAPRFTRETWRNELKVMGLEDEGFYAVSGIGGKSGIPKGTRWIFMHYEVLDAWVHVLPYARPKVRVSIFDEAHWLKNGRSKRGKAAFVAQAPHTIALTGTPLANRPSELYSVLSLVTGQGTWGSFFEFRQRYCGAYPGNHGWVDGQPTNVVELRDRLADVYTRIELADAGIHLPPLRRQVLEVEAEDDDRLDGVTLRRVFEALLVGHFGDDTLRQIMALRQASSMAKRRATCDAVSSMLEQGDSVLLFAWQRKTVEALAAGIRKRVKDASVQTHHGGLGTAGDLAVQEWQRSLGAGVLVATLDSLKEGVTLTRARHVVLHDLSWVPSEVLQAEARVHRIGQTWPCTSTWVKLAAGIDPLILRAFVQKAHAQRSALGFGATLQALQELGVTPADDDGFAWLAEHAAELATRMEGM